MKTMNQQREQDEVAPLILSGDSEGSDNADDGDSLRFQIGGPEDDHDDEVDGRVEVHYDLQQRPSGDVNRVAPRGGPVEQWESDLQSERRVVGGAAVAGGIAGLVLAGPIVALVVAGGAAAMATTKGKAGEVTRATGEVMAQAGDRLKTIDRKHKISDKATKSLAKSANWVSEKLKTKRERETDAMTSLTS